ncbi:hypothetical protein HNQ91_003034 [Filimonas zeae]|uniref:Uncharacterized protein n=1 Tax=Filimonas zeae TaxID=1737353 RepID=A0A917MWI6_9BACT|nr:hypothetical protein [Filimonas zeae]MDR6339969.1 hypothetical protein [Filimonas zeae]GGH70514.1 hypothetical protein GCM10011379_28870 [Filimonas zeae]
MKVVFIAELDAEARFETVLYRYMDVMSEYFSDKNYGEGIPKICLCPVCRPSYLQLKQRVRMDHKNKIFYCDIMYNFEYWVSADTVGREADFFTGFRQIIPFLEKRKYKNFDVAAFERDMEAFLSEYI